MRRLGVGVVLVALAGAMLGAPGARAPLRAVLCVAPAFAQGDSVDQAARRRQADSLEAAKRGELEDLRRQALEKRAAASRLKGQETRALGELRRTERELNLTRRRLRSLGNRRARLGEELEVTRASLERSTVALSFQRERLARRLRGLYKYGPAREIEYLMSTRSFAELMTRWDYLLMVAEQDQVLLEDFRGQKELVESSKRELEDNLTQIRQVESRASTESRKLTVLRQQKAGAVKDIRTQRADYEAAAVELEKNARELQRLLARLEKQRRDEEARAKAQGLAPQPYAGDFAKSEGALDWPARGPLVGHLGPEKHPRFGTTTLNNGIDIQVPPGTAVRAVARGKVDYLSEDFGAYGQVVIVNHGDGYFTLYANLSEILVAQGQVVASGQVIAKSGDSGSLKGPILHFEVRKGGTALDPEDWLQ